MTNLYTFLTPHRLWASPCALRRLRPFSSHLPLLWTDQRDATLFLVDGVANARLVVLFHVQWLLHSLKDGEVKRLADYVVRAKYAGKGKVGLVSNDEALRLGRGL